MSVGQESTHDDGIGHPPQDPGLSSVAHRNRAGTDAHGRPNLPRHDRVFGYFSYVEEDGVWRLYHPTNGNYLEGTDLDDIVQRTTHGDGSILVLRIPNGASIVSPGPDGPESVDLHASPYKFPATTPWHV